MACMFYLGLYTLKKTKLIILNADSYIFKKKKLVNYPYP